MFGFGIMKFTGRMNSPTLMSMTSTFPLEILTDLSANWRVTLVDLNSPALSYLLTKYRSKFTLAPKSRNVLSMIVFLIVHEIVG